MNNRQKEIIQSQLNSEEQTLKKLRGIYKKALDDIDSNVAALLGRTDKENLQSIIYQVDYQKALRKQIGGILDTMNAEQFKTISEYLEKCYEEGFVGTMYDLHGQGIPLIMPIDQDQVVRALQHDSKLSKPLYDSLGEDVDLLKKRIQNNLSRGIAQGSSYADIARNIASGMVGDYGKMRGGALGKAYTIARTEGHRITQEATHDAQKKAVEKGADVVKQWDATVDRRTRPHHAQLDGQIREVDEPFEIAGRKAMYPGGFGVAAEDIHCRCVSLQRAKWALDEDELKTLQDRAEYFGLDKTKDFDNFKEKYLDIPDAKEENGSGKSYDYVPSNNIKEAETFARNTLGIEHVSYKGLDVETANAMNESLTDALNYTDSIKERMRFYGSAQERNKILKPLYEDYYFNEYTTKYGMSETQARKFAKSSASKSLGRVEGNVYAMAYNRSKFTGGVHEYWNQYTGIGMNNAFGKDASKFFESVVSDMDSGWHPANSTSLRSVFDHEIGHQIDYALDLRKNPAMTALYSSFSREEIKNGLSGYATTNIAEFIAEGYCEYLNNPNPREIATQIGKIIESEVKKAK